MEGEERARATRQSRDGDAWSPRVPVMIVRPMIGEWEVPRIEHIQTLESRRLARLSVPGLRGDLHQDLGQHSLIVEISGSLHGDEEREAFLSSVREPFNAGAPVAFVADITSATELEEVLIEHLDLSERNDHADSFIYTIRLRQYVEPPEPPTPIDELGAELGPELDALAALGDLALDLPNMLGDIPSVGDPTPPLREALAAVESTVAPLNDLLAELGNVFA